jgi:hypothetical protein
MICKGGDIMKDNMYIVNFDLATISKVPYDQKIFDNIKYSSTYRIFKSFNSARLELSASLARDLKRVTNNVEALEDKFLDVESMVEGDCLVFNHLKSHASISTQDPYRDAADVVTDHAYDEITLGGI